MQIIKATVEHLQKIVPLFDAYRVFYGKSSDIENTKKFIADRLTTGDSTILIALDLVNQESMGFVQLYPSFSSINMKKIFILNDLFVNPKFRKKGLARELLRSAKKFAMVNNAAKIILETAPDNVIAQQLYASENYIKDSSNFYVYYLELP